MGKIDKVMQPKHEETLSSWVRSFVSEAADEALPLLPARLEKFPETWPFPRGDLYHWIPLLNRFDSILDRFCAIYKLNEGPQMRDIGQDLLRNQDKKGDGEDSWDLDRLKKTGYAEDGDMELLLAVLRFTRMLLKHCGNRSIYDSSAHLNHLLNTTSLPLLLATLKVGSELAQRYQASVKRVGLANRHLSNVLLANHYNIDLNRVQDIASPFVKTPIGSFTEHATATTPSSTSKGKEKAHSPSRKSQSTMFASDLVALATAENDRWNGWGDVKVTYYPRPIPQPQVAPPVNPERGHPTAPSTPTPLRRSTSVHQTTTQTPSPRQGRSALFDDSSPAVFRNATATGQEESLGGQKSFELLQNVVAQSSIYSLLSRIPADAPDAAKYEMLHRVRVAKALLDSTASRQQILAIRLLAITNLAFIHSEPVFVERVLRQDADETRRFQLVYQLVELIHPSADGSLEVPIWLQTATFQVLEPIATLAARCQDVLTALNVNVNHGILLYVIRKAVAGMKQDEPGGDGTQMTEIDKWRLSLFELTMSLSMSTRVGSEMASAGLMEILIEMLNMRSKVSQRHHAMVLAFLDGLIWSFQNAFQAFFNTNGLDALADLFVFTASEAQKLAVSGKGTGASHQSQSIDYEIPYHQQQTLKWLLKFLHNVMTNAYSYGANTDRLLRNLADKSDLLRSLKAIVENMRIFGSVVWTNVVTMMSDFINNDPTSFAAISESGLIRTYIEVITRRPLTEEQLQRRESGTNEQADTANTQRHSATEADHRSHPPSLDVLEQPREHALGAAILPSADALSVVPIALNSISLNNDGLRLVILSRVFDSFFEVFESPRHVRCMQTEHHLANNLGAHFDELARHHPSLRPSISNAVIDMVARVCYMADAKAKKHKWGASLKLLYQGSTVIADEEALRGQLLSNTGELVIDNDQDVEMKDASDPGEVVQQPTGKTKRDEDSSELEDFKPYISALTGFLGTYIANQNLKDSFLQKGGLEMLLNLVQSPSLPFDFCEAPACRLLVRAIALLIESSPALGLTSLLKRTQEAIDTLSPLIDGTDPSFFARFLQEDPQARLEDLGKPEITSATKILRALLQAQVLLKILADCFASGRGNVSSFLPANAYDYFLRLIQSFGLLFPALLEEEASELTAVPTHWCLRRSQSLEKEGLRRQHISAPNAEVDQGLEDNNNVQDVLTGMSEAPGSALGQLRQPNKDEQSSLRYQNFNTLRIVLHPLIPSIFPLLKTVGRSLMPKRERDNYIRSRHLELAKAIASAVLEPLKKSVASGDPSTRDLHYWIVMLHTIHETLVDHPRPNERLPHLLIIPVLVAFKEVGGFAVLDSMLRVFKDEICKDSAATDDANRLKLTPYALRKVLDLYSLLVNTRNVHDSTGQFGLQTRIGDRRELLLGDYFLVEFRRIIVPIIKELWNSELVEKTPDAPPHNVLDRIVDILRSIGTADGEMPDINDINILRLFQKTDYHISWVSWQPVVRNLVNEGYDQDLASEAVYRAMGNAVKAKEYCVAYTDGLAGTRNPIPPEDAYQPPPADRPAETSASTVTSPVEQNQSNSIFAPATEQDTDAMLVDATAPGAVIDGIIGEAIIGSMADRSSQSSDTSVESSHETEPQNPSDEQHGPSELATADSNGRASGAAINDVQVTQRISQELTDIRNEVRGNLIDRCLDVVRAHPHAAIDISDLINAMIFRHVNNEEAREDVGDTLANALSSLAMDEEERNLNSGSIASYAHLLALLLQQDKPFFESCLDTLRAKVDEYLDFLKLSPSGSQDSLPPWIPYILLILELLLAHDAQPVECQWKPPTTEDEVMQQPVLQMVEPTVTEEQRLRLLDSLLEIFPRIGKEETLATSVLRVVIILCRSRNIAKAIGEKKNLQRLFVMAKQIVTAGADRMGETKLTANLMIILRRIVEDEETTKQILRAEIRSCFEQARHPRGLDTIGFLRAIPAVALWAPELFVEVTNEMVCMARWMPGAAETGRYLILQLKETASHTLGPVEAKEENQDSEGPSAGDLSVTEMKQSIQDIKQSTEEKDLTDTPKAEAKRLVVENPDGVIHFLLCELLNYREVEDRDPLPPPPPPPSKDAKDGESSSVHDATNTSSGGTETVRDKKAPRPQFKVEEHPIFIYRCFLLNCLAELLGSYNRTKMEFINFKRSAPPLQQSTPVKPRSSILHYLINDYLCQGNLTGITDTVSAKKKAAISAHAQRVLVALVLKTSEKNVDKNKPKYELDEDEPDLLFVRKFVLDTVIKAYEKAPGPDETLEARYSRMQSLAELMNCMIGEKENGKTQGSTRNPDGIARSQTQFRRMMYEKGYLDKLTASIAEIDLSYPGVKRAIKYILRVLRSLTDTAKELSRANVISSPSPPGPAGDDDVESDSSISDIDDQREETPDLYRNSTLGMLEPHGDEDESDEDEDEEMYDDGYAEDMDYTEEGESSQVSEEDELGDMGDIEGLHGNVVDIIVQDEDEDEDEEDDDDMDSDEMDEGEEDHVEVVEDGEDHAEDDNEEWESHSDDGNEDEDEEEFEEGNNMTPAGANMHRGIGDDLVFAVMRDSLGEPDGVRLDERFSEGGPEQEDEEEEVEEENDDEFFYDDQIGDVAGRAMELQELEWEVVHDLNQEPPYHTHHHRHHDPQIDADGNVERALARSRLVPRGPLPSSFVVDRDSVAGQEGFSGYFSQQFAQRARMNGNPNTPDDGTNPLLRRSNAFRDTSPRPRNGQGVISSVRVNNNVMSWADGPMSFINELMDLLPLGRAPGGGIHLQITTNPAGGPHEHYFVSHEARGGGGRRDGTSMAMEPQQAVSFTPERTSDRYTEEGRMIFGSQIEACACRLWALIQAKLTPPAIEIFKKLKVQEEERRKLAEEKRKKIEEAERAVREAKEAEDKAAQEKKEAEEREAAERAAAEAVQAAAAAAQATVAQEATDASAEAVGSQADLLGARPMEGIETAMSSSEAGAGAAEPDEQQPRVVTRLRGEDLDITDLGIDPEYLAALPDEFREEVIAQAVSTRRSQARQEAATGTAEPEDYQEFLDALPEDLRHEIIQQERAEQRRRDRDEQRRQISSAGGGAAPATDEGPVDMDAASILLTFPPALREQVLMEQGQVLMDQLTPELASEARRLAQQHGTIPARTQATRRSGLFPQQAGTAEPAAASAADKMTRRSVIQMLDKPGVATLLRLMFIAQQGSIRQYLFSVLCDVCENRQNRLEVISTLLQILQDGSTDMEAVERSFGQLSLKAKRPKDIKEADPKTPSQLRRNPTDLVTSGLGRPNTEVSPLLIVNQCLDLLIYLCGRNSQTPWLFLTEADMSASLKRVVSKKGKPKEVTKFVAINSLLALLDRDLVMESSGTMTNLADLLNKITTPLLTLERRRKEAEEEKKAAAAAESSQGPGAEASATSELTAVDQATPTALRLAAGSDQINSGQSASPGQPPDDDAPATEAAGSSKLENKGKEAPPKKPKIIPPPFIIASNLTLVVRIFVARECSSKTFQNTISTIKNLSTVPGAKTGFGEELVRQARILSENIVSDLSELLPHIVKAKSGTEIQGVALARFSPGASDQNKLLRVLTALDHLFETKKKSGQDEEDAEASEKQDLVTSLYNNPTFATMWDRLSACLAAIRQRENMINVATILLPLIETFMVVCKNTATQEAPNSQLQISKEMLLSSPPPESPLAGLFFSFTEDHRRILNELVRNSPKLMSGTFALLVKNPMVLEFDNKRNYFNRSVHSRNNGNQARPSFQPLQLSVRRDQVFHDSFRSLFFKSGDEMKFGKLNIRFHGEEGVDAGGVTREWFQVLSRQMFYPGYALFESVPSDRTTFHPYKLSSVNEEHLMFFKFIGRVIGKALYEGRVLDCYFSRAVYKRILGKSVSVKDMESFDPDYYKSLVWMLDNDITDIITETFSVEEDAFGVKNIYDLIPNGRETKVTEDNKQEYVRLLVEHKLLSSVKEQMENFLTGFHDIIPAELIAIFNEQELELLISGLPEIDVDDWKGNAEYHGYQASSQQIQWFWRAVRSFDKEERAKLLQFVTGTSKVPLNGFKELEGMNGINRFNIHRDYGNKDRLPSSHTCFNQLDLPEYESYEFLRSQLIKAITAGSNYFGFA